MTERQQARDPKDPPKFRTVSVEAVTRQKVTILAGVRQVHVYELVGEAVDREWAEAKQAGLVRDAMLQAVEAPA